MAQALRLPTQQPQNALIGLGFAFVGVAITLPIVGHASWPIIGKATASPMKNSPRPTAIKTAMVAAQRNIGRGFFLTALILVEIAAITPTLRCIISGTTITIWV